MADAASLRASGNALFQSGDYLRAAADFTKALKLGSDVEASAAIHSNRSAAFAALGKARQALADADSAVSLRPSWDKAHYRRGVALQVRPPVRWPACPPAHASLLPPATCSCLKGMRRLCSRWRRRSGSPRSL